MTSRNTKAGTEILSNLLANKKLNAQLNESWRSMVVLNKLARIGSPCAKYLASSFKDDHKLLEVTEDVVEWLKICLPI